MNSVLSFQPQHTCIHDMSSLPPTMNSRKRKADDDELMTPSPPPHSQQLQRPVKKHRLGPAGRPLALPRLLETLDSTSLRDVLRSLCIANPSVAQEIVKIAPNPSVAAAIEVLHRYENDMQTSFPFGGDSGSDYAYHRVKGSQNALLEALGDFTPHFLPPNETQVSSCLEFLDEATNIIHRLPNWNTFQNSMAKANAYDEIAGAWSLVIQEAAKKAAGMALRYDGWDEKILKHVEISQGRLEIIVDELNQVLGWTSNSNLGHQQGRDQNTAVQELLAGTYGSNVPVRVGPW